MFNHDMSQIKGKKHRKLNYKKLYGEYDEKMCHKVNEFNLHLEPHQFLFVLYSIFMFFSMYFDNSQYYYSMHCLKHWCLWNFRFRSIFYTVFFIIVNVYSFTVLKDLFSVFLFVQKNFFLNEKCWQIYVFKFRTVSGRHERVFIVLLFTMLSFFSDNHSILIWQPCLRFHVYHSHLPSAIVCAHHFLYRRVNLRTYIHTYTQTCVYVSSDFMANTMGLMYIHVTNNYTKN